MAKNVFVYTVCTHYPLEMEVVEYFMMFAAVTQYLPVWSFTEDTLSGTATDRTMSAAQVCKICTKSVRSNV
jgi:hypothetical protein